MEEERISVSEKLDAEKVNSKPAFIDASPVEINAFILDYRKNLEYSESHTKKTVIQSVIANEIYDGETLELVPSYPKITGVMWCPPRGIRTPVAAVKEKIKCIYSFAYVFCA